MSKIAENEKRITELKQEKESLLKQRKLLKEEKQQYMFVKRDEVNIHDELKEFEEISKKEVNAELNTERIRAWILKNFKKVYNI